ncbi:MAG: tRNA (N(6)-L-threonylcarbamoyladenosine(37)-C(2))-methylthiotransferase MtaB [Bacteroidales bacterium]|nr:tRNA (N(6)-L-threonylcarbamoyladenosine(37)-C(2))-methylthiotransferase MtaB [Bacteroidales bacterium]
MKRIASYTLGCKLNFAETSQLVRQFVAAGYTPVEFHEKADLYVINTCTVTAIAEKKCRNIVRQAVACNPRAIVAVIGCFAQNDAEMIAMIPGVDIILGNNDKHRLPEIVEERLSSPDHSAPLRGEKGTPTSFQLSYSMGDRTRTFFKIQDGCDYFCTYCAIPYARGRSRSATIEETVAMARQIAAEGAKEVVLTGVNTGTFGLHQQESFLDLLRRLDDIESIARYRISSIEPNLLNDDIIHFVAHSKRFAHHFHIPLQAGTDKVLRLMNRRYDTAFYADKLHSIRQLMPDCCIAADLMVGFYGEDEETFQQSLGYVDSLPLSYLHVFTYSERPNTRALTFTGKVPIHLRRLHTNQMIDLSEKKKKAFYRSNIGRKETVLWESDVKEGMMFGFTGNYLRVSTPHQESLVNTLQEVTLDRLDSQQELFFIEKS